MSSHMSNATAELFMEMLKDKPAILATICEDMNACDANAKAFDKLYRLYDEGRALNMDVVMKSTAQVIAVNNKLLIRMLLLLMTYVQSSDFNSDVAQMLIKMGHGKEALQEMFAAKLRGAG